MEAIIGLIVLLILAIPVMSIVAIVKVTNVQKKVAENERRINILSKKLAQQIQKTPAAPKPTEPEPVIETPVVMEPKTVEKPKPIPVETPMPQTIHHPTHQVTPPPIPKPKPKKNIEEALGGKVAGLIGVMILVAGIAFLVGSPGIAWPTPLFKILMGLFFGGILLAAGYFANRTAGGKFVMLSRILTGGGGGLFYFCIFAAYSLYSLCGPWVTTLGLTLSAALLLFLSLVYNSQIVAILGVLGAFITPLLTGGDVDQGIFPLAYIALINLPVMFLGVKKNWQVLYNSATVFTWLYFFFWIARFNTGGWLVPLSALTVYTAEFMTLSLLILMKRNDTERAGINVARIAASTLFLFFNLYLIFNLSNLEPQLTIAFAVVSGAFVLLSRLAWSRLPEFKNETLCFILCGSAAISVLLFEAAPSGTRGLLWCAQATALAWFFRKPAPGKIFFTSILLTLLGGTALSLRMLDDGVIDPRWFNLETLYLLTGAFFAGTTCWILRLHSDSTSIHRGGRILQVGSFAMILVAACTDIFSFSSTDTLPWAAATAAFSAAIWVARKQQPSFIKQTLYFTLGALFCLAVTLHMLLAGLWISLAWGLLGLAAAWLALRVQSKELQNSALIIGFAALLHATLQPITLGAGLVLVNPHTLCGLFTALAIGGQAALYARIPQKATEARTRLLWLTCIGAVLFIATRNLFTALSADTPWPWMLSSIVVLFVGNLVSWMFRHDNTLRKTGTFLVAVLPVKIILLDVLVLWGKGTPPALLSIPLWVQIGMLAEILWFASRIQLKDGAARGWFALTPLLTVIAIISLAIGGLATTWSWAIVSLWWGLAGLSLTLYGFIRKSKLHRHTALLLFAATIGKVLLVDCSVFDAGPRVMIFIVIGLLLLVLSFIYQKVSSKIL